MYSRLFQLLLLSLILVASCKPKEVNHSSKLSVAFEKFRQQEKFLAEPGSLYTGLADSSLRPVLSEKLNQTATDFEKLTLSGKASDEDYQKAIGKGLARFEGVSLALDTEDRERLCKYFEELMDIAGVKSSNGQLNTFMCGFE